MIKPSFWTAEKTEELKLHRDSGLSGSAIAQQMGVTRNTVIGKLYRLGLTLPGTPRLSPEERERRRKEKNAVKINRQRIRRHENRGWKVQEPTIPVAVPPFIGSLNIPFGDLRRFTKHSPNQCRYIAAEPAGPDYLACGNETLKGESWCAHCKDVVFASPKNYSDEERDRRRRWLIKVGHPSKVGRVVDDGVGEAA
jgi:hypothetical protein